MIRCGFGANRLLDGFRHFIVSMFWKETDFKLGAEVVIQQRAKMSKLWVKMLTPTVAWKCSHPFVKQRESPSTRLR